MINRYFNFTTFSTEQSLVDDLIIESIQIYGHEAYYIPRQDVAIDTILGEDGLSKYVTAYPIELYLSSFDQFMGESEFISKFGLHIEDQARFSVSATRFFQSTNNAIIRPRENDIIFIEFTPTNRYIFEIRFVENKEQLFQLGKLYTYELRCEMMNFSHERVQTGNTVIDQRTQSVAYSIKIDLGTGTGTYTNGEIVYQGTSFMSASATATVYQHDVANSALYVLDVTGAFNGTDAITGITSNASYVPTAVPDEAPTTHDPISDNKELAVEAPSIIVKRGSNPLTGQ